MSSKNLIKSIGQIFDISDSYAKTSRKQIMATFLKSDSKNLEKDWINVGSDIRRALYHAKKGEIK